MTARNGVDGGHTENPSGTMKMAPLTSTKSSDSKGTARSVLDFRIEHRGKVNVRLVMGVFANLQRAGSAMLALEERGFAPEDITLRLIKETRDAIEGRRVFRDQRGITYIARMPIPVMRVRRSSEGLGLGALAGAITGMLLSFFAGDAGVPYVSLFGAAFFARAVVMWALVGIGAAFGAAVGGFLGSTRVNYFASDYTGCKALEGAIVGVAVHDDAEAEAVERDLQVQGAEVVSSA
jgi:hypothetical protein